MSPETSMTGLWLAARGRPIISRPNGNRRGKKDAKTDGRISENAPSAGGRWNNHRGDVRDELRNIMDYNKKLNAFITIFDEESQPALTRARAVDSSLGGHRGEDGLLLGVPLVMKDDFFLAGYRTTNACFAFRNFVPNTTASMVEGLLRMGMVPLGKTNMHELALGATSSSSFFGPVRNPHDRIGYRAAPVVGRLSLWLPRATRFSGSVLIREAR